MSEQTIYEDNAVEQNPIRTHIYRYYTPNMQTEDGTWKNYYTTLLKAKGVENLEADIVAKVIEVQNGKSLDEIVTDVDDALKPAYQKLVKIGVRTSWAYKIIEESLLAQAENREPVYVDFPTF